MHLVGEAAGGEAAQRVAGRDGRAAGPEAHAAGALQRHKAAFTCGSNTGRTVQTLPKGDHVSPVTAVWHLQPEQQLMIHLRETRRLNADLSKHVI